MNSLCSTKRPIATDFEAIKWEDCTDGNVYKILVGSWIGAAINFKTESLEWKIGKNVERS